MVKKIPEIVAPGGSWSKAVIAALNGAEAVYVGVPFTSLRMRQNKIKTFELLRKTIDDIHKIGAKAYLTMNIFPRNIDIKVFESIVERISDLWADAIIFSDPGTYKIIRKYLPDIPLHLSTQTNTLNRAAVKFWYDLWVKRIVLARELHIKEIEEIKNKVPDMELEVFVHGAMCMSYSGRCLLGEYFSGRDGNKWECSHVCRYKFKVYLEEEKRPWRLFQLVEDEQWSYLLSSKDLCTIERLWELLNIVDWLKIEWRSKSEFYVASTVKAYRHVRDAILSWKKIDEEIKNLVYKIPHRYYWEWFLFNNIRFTPEMEITDWKGNLKEEFQKLSENDIRRKIYNINDDILEKKNIRELLEIIKDDDINCCGDFLPGYTLSSITYDRAWPLKIGQYLWYTFSTLDDYLEGKEYNILNFVPKDTIFPGQQLNFIAPYGLWKVKIEGIYDLNEKPLDKATCNYPVVKIKFSKPLRGFEVFYK